MEATGFGTTPSRKRPISMRETAIYIPTKNRPQFLVKCLANLEAEIAREDIPVHLIVVSEARYKAEVKAALSTVRNVGVWPVWLRQEDRGIGYARAAIVRHAARAGYVSAAMVDDDQLVRGNIGTWLELASREDVTGIGAWKSWYGRNFMGTELASGYGKPANPGLYLCKFGFCSVAFNVANVMECGNYRPELRSFEDTDMIMKSVATLRLPWYVYNGTFAGDVTIQKEQRADGTSTFNPQSRAEAGELMRKFWPGYTSAPGKKLAILFKRLVADYMPELWERWPMENIRTDEAWDWDVC